MSRFKILQYGSFGTRKTSRACTARAFGKVLILDFDDKAEAGIKALGKEDFQRDILVEKYFPGHDEPSKILNRLDDLRQNPEQNQIATVVIDSWTNLFNLIAQQILKANANKKSKYGFMRPRLDVGEGLIVESLERADYMMAMSIQETTLNKLLSLPHNIIVNHHVGDKKDKDGNVLGPKIGISGSFGEAMPRRFLELHHVFVDNLQGRYKIRVRNNGKFEAGTLLDDKFIDKDGTLKADYWDLKVFGDLAYRTS